MLDRFRACVLALVVGVTLLGCDSEEAKDSGGAPNSGAAGTSGSAGASANPQAGEGGGGGEGGASHGSAGASGAPDGGTDGGTGGTGGTGVAGQGGGGGASGSVGTVYVATDGSGDYECDGTSDQEQINLALEQVAREPRLGRVHLKGPATYWIDEPIVIPSHTKLTGDATVKVQLVDHAGWPLNKPLVRQKGAEHWKGTLSEAIYGTKSDSITDVEISGFEITAGKQNARTGTWAYIIMIFYSASDLKIHHMHLHGSYGDLIRVMSPGSPMNENLEFSDNLLEDSGHDGLYLGYVSHLKVLRNEIYSIRTNIAVRVGQSRDVSIIGNTIGNRLDARPSGYAGIYLDNDELPLHRATVADNFLFGKAGGIVLKAGDDDKGQSFIDGVHIHHNRIYRTFDNTAGGAHYLNGAIHIHGANRTLIEHNTIVGSDKDGIVYEHGDHKGGAQVTIVRNNIIVDCAGFGINDLAASGHSFQSSYNDIYQCARGSYHRASSSTDIHEDPLLAASGGGDPKAVDFHLRSTAGRWTPQGWVKDARSSPCIDEADPSSPFGEESRPNGGRANIGAYGNTAQASRSQQ